MITLYDIIDKLGETIDKKLILNRFMVPNSSFPAYKEFTYSVYRIDNDKRQIFEFTNKMNTSKDGIEKCWEVSDKKCLTVLMRWILNKGYEYSGKQVSD